MQHCKVLKNSDPVRARSVRVPEIPFYDGYITFSDLRDHMEVFLCADFTIPGKGIRGRGVEACR